MEQWGVACPRIVPGGHGAVGSGLSQNSARRAWSSGEWPVPGGHGAVGSGLSQNSARRAWSSGASEGAILRHYTLILKRVICTLLVDIDKFVTMHTPTAYFWGDGGEEEGEEGRGGVWLYIDAHAYNLNTHLPERVYNYGIARSYGVPMVRNPTISRSLPPNKKKSCMLHSCTEWCILCAGPVPPDGTPIKRLSNQPLAFVIVYYTLATMGIVYALVCLLFNILFRNRK